MTGFAHMEDIVRPFTPADFINSLRSGPPRVAPEIPGIVAVSLGGNGPRTFTWSMTGSGAVSEPGNSSESYKETERSTSQVRVENPDDSSQYVEFCRADKISLANTAPKVPARTSSYDLSGGYHSSTQNPKRAGGREYSFKYPADKVCRAKEPDRKKGCA